ncbi:MAG: metallophosphoesterase [Oscillospiraceae bacterium]|nr:metallophosphoesterase [Oscillospiraceae bacterium]
MKQKMKKVLSLFLVAVMLLSVIAPAVSVPALATQQEQADAQTPDLRVGILSDVHLGYAPDKVIQTVRFKKALEVFKEMGVDAVIVAGDLQDGYGTDEVALEDQKYYMEEFASTWFEVFPADSGVEPIVIYGNHDDNLIAQAYWPESLGSYTDAFRKEVNGYQFVGVHNGKEGVSAVDAYLSEAAAASADKPVFYIQHYPVYQTVPGSFGNYSYSKDGFENLVKYPNAVAFNGHTHCPLTDERSIWQGEDWQAPFTVVNTGTINYSGLGQSGLGSSEMPVSVNGFNGDTQHGMYMTVTGSQVSIDRYSFAEETPVKLGQTWSFDACDTADRPYVHADRYEMAAAPVFAEGAALSVSNITDTAVTVQIPAAELPAVEGFSDMIHAYVVEAVDPANGMVMARGAVATEHHIDTQERFASAYTVNLTGLQPGKTYTVNAYALEFFQKRSAPLTASVTTTGTAQLGIQGDVNGDGTVDADDLTLLQAICAGTAEDTQWSDVDGNRVKEKADLAALENILANEKAVSEDPAVDALGSSSYVSFTNYGGNAWSYGLQTAVTNGGTGVALKAACTEAAAWPYGKVYFDEPLDWSAYSELCFDSLFTNENNTNWLAVSLISGYQYQLSSAVYPSHGNGWTTNTVSLGKFTDVDFSDIRGIQFSYNMTGYEGRYDGVTEHGIFMDNLHAELTVLDAPDSDLLGTAAQITGGQRLQGVGQVAGNGSLEAVQATANAVNVTFAEELALDAVEGFTLAVKVSGDLSVQAVAADGSLMGSAAAVTGNGKWQSHTVSLEALGLTGSDVIAGLCFTADDSGYGLDNLYVQLRTDGDLSDQAIWVNSSPESYSISVQGKATNNSSVAAEIKVISDSPWDWPKFDAYFPAGFDGQTRYLSFDVKRAEAGGILYVVAQDANGNQIGSDLLAATPAANSWTTYNIDLMEKGFTEEQIGQIARIRFAPYINPNSAQIGDAMYVDNLQFLHDDDLTSEVTWKGTWEVNYTQAMQTQITNGSKEAAMLKVITANPNAWPQLNAQLSTALEGRTRYLTVDVKRAAADGTLWISAYDANGAKLGNADLVADYSAANGKWKTYTVDLLEKGFTQEQISQIAVIRFSPMINSGSAQIGDAMYVDNLRFLQDDDLISGAALTCNIADKYSVVLQSEVTNGSHEAIAVKVASADPGRWLQLNVNLSSAVSERSQYLTFDLKRAAAGKNLWVTAYDAGGNRLGNDLVAANPTTNGWTTYTIDLLEKGLTEEQIGQIATIRFSPDMDSANAQIGDAMYVDNLRFLFEDDNEEEEAFTGDLLTGSAWANSSEDHYTIELQSAVTNCTGDAVAITATQDGPWAWPKFDVYFPTNFKGQTRYVSFDVKRTIASGTLYVCALDADGNKLGEDLVAVTPAAGVWTTYTVDLLSKGLTEEQVSQVAAIRFAPSIQSSALAGQAMYVDNLQFLQDDDLISVASVSCNIADKYSVLVQSKVTNGSHEAAAVKVVSADPGRWLQLNIQLPTAVTERSQYLTFDLKRAAAGKNLWVSVHDANGNKLGEDLVAANPATSDWTTYTIDLLEKGLTEEQISQIAIIRFAPDMDSANAMVGDGMYVDNLKFLTDDNA